jgi:hypothetical protein
MVRIIDRNDRESFSDRFLRGLNQAGQKLPEGLEQYAKYKKTEAKELAAKTKGLPKSMDAYLKKFHPSYLEDENRYNDLSDLTRKYAEAGHSHENATRQALDDIKNRSGKKSGVGLGSEGGFAETRKLGRGPKVDDKFVGGALGEFINQFQESPGPKKYSGDQSVMQRFGEFNKGLGRSAASHAQDIASHPGKVLAEVGSGIANLAAMPIDVIEAGLKRGGFIAPDANPNIVRQALNKVGQWINEGKSPEEIERSSKREFASSFLPIGSLLKGLNWLGGKFKGASSGGSGLGTAAEEVVGASKNLRMRQNSTLTSGIFEDAFGRPKQAPSGVKPPVKVVGKGLGERSTAGEVRGPTGSRIERAALEGKIFKPNAQAEIREKQLKMHPKYADEIAADAAERTARAEAKSPKTPVGEAGVAKRMAIAEAELPKAQEAYHRTAARVRSIENQLSRGALPEHRAQLEGLYESAVKELNEAEFHLRNTINNAKTGEARVGAEPMRQAARNKLMRISDELAEGREAHLALRDYNPEMIKKAKALSKKNALPSTRHEDYFTKVHEGYANEYRTRLNQLDQELAKLKDAKTLAPLQQGIQLNKEKELVQKLIDHVEAENALHRHKMALRETQQRKVAADRLGKYTRQAGNEKVKELAKNALKSPEQAAHATDVAFEEVAAQTKDVRLRDKILKEREAVRSRMEKLASGEEPVTKAAQSASEGATTAKEATEKTSRVLNDLKQVLESLKNGGQNFFKTRIGKDLLIGVGSEILSQSLKGEDLPFSSSTLIAVLGGGGIRGAGYRTFFSQMTRSIWNKGRKEEYKKALREGNDEKLLKLNSKISPKLKKESIEEFRRESSETGQ